MKTLGQYMRAADEENTKSRTVAAHDARNASLDGAHEWMDVDLVLCPVVNVRRLLEPKVLLFAASHPMSTVSPGSKLPIDGRRTC